MNLFQGHNLVGSFFFIQGLWCWLNVLILYYKSCQNQQSISSSSFKTSSWYPIPIKWVRSYPIEPILRFSASITGIFVQLIPDHSYILIGKDGQFVQENLNNYAHAVMYTMFGIWSLIEVMMFYHVVQLPDRSGFLFLSLALFVEGILFVFHLDGRPKLDKMMHTFLYMIIFMTAAVTVLEGWIKDSFLLLAVRSFLFMLQGTWFIQIAHSLYGTIPWKNIKVNRDFLATLFSGHILVLLLIAIIGFIVLSVKVNGCHDCFKKESRRDWDDDMTDDENTNNCVHERKGLIKDDRN